MAQDPKASGDLNSFMGDPGTSPIPDPTTLPDVMVPGAVPDHPPSHRVVKPTKHGSTHRGDATNIDTQSY